MSNPQEYKNLITEIVQKQMTILGPDVALLKARQVDGLKVDDSGQVKELSGKEEDVLQGLIDNYIELSGEIVKNILSQVFERYPTIKAKIK